MDISTHFSSCSACSALINFYLTDNIKMILSYISLLTRIYLQIIQFDGIIPLPHLWNESLPVAPTHCQHVTKLRIFSIEALVLQLFSKLPKHLRQHTDTVGLRRFHTGNVAERGHYIPKDTVHLALHTRLYLFGPRHNQWSTDAPFAKCHLSQTILALERLGTVEPRRVGTTAKSRTVIASEQNDSIV